MSTKTTTKKRTTGASSTRPSTRATAVAGNAAINTVNDTAASNNPPPAGVDAAAPATEPDPSVPTTTSEDTAPPSQSTELSSAPSSDQTAGSAPNGNTTSTPSGDSSTLPTAAEPDPPVPNDDTMSVFRRDLRVIVEDAEGIFQGLTTQVSQSFESVDKAYSYLSRARREVEVAHRRAEESRNSLNNAIGRFGHRMREIQARFDPDNVSDPVEPREANTRITEPPEEPAVNAPQEIRPQSPPLGDEDYADPAPQPPQYHDAQPISLSDLFAPRRADESDAEFEGRLDTQRRWLDTQGVFQARRDREARANAAWEDIAAGRQHYIVPPSEPGGGPPDDDGNDDPPQDPGRDARRPRHPHHPSRGGFGRGRGGGPPGGGPPGGGHGGDDSDGSPSTDDEHDEREPSLAASRRHITRSPSYMPERPLRDARDGRIPRDHVGPYHPETNDAFVRESLRRIRRMIRDKLGEQLPENAALKNVKNLPTPDKYGGEDDIEVFEGWFKSLLRWLRFMRLGGPALEEERTQIMGLFLKGKAFEWFNDTIDSSLVRGPPWKFSEAVCAMFERFLHHANAGLAADKFYSVTYSKDTGVHGLWDNLVKYAARMPQPPDDYTFARKFAAALPPDVGVPLFRNKNLTIEGTTPRILYDMAVQQEHNNKQADFYRTKVSSARTTTATQATTSGAPGPSRSASDQRPAAATQVSAPGSHPDTLRSNSRPPQPFVRSMKRSDYDSQRRAGGNSVSFRPRTNPSASSGGRDGAKSAPSASTFNASRPANASHSQPKAAGARNQGCYNCGELGHFSNNCPHPQRAGFRAARVLDGTEEPAVPSEPSEPTALESTSEEHASEEALAVSTSTLDEEYYDAIGGSQYDSADDNDILDDYVAEDDDVIFFAGMHRRLETLIEDDEEYSLSETQLYEQLRTTLHALPGSASYLANVNVRETLRSLVSDAVVLPGMAAAANPEGAAAYHRSGLSAAAWELTQLLQHLRTEPDAPFYVDNLVVRRMIRRLLAESPPLPFGMQEGPSTDPRLRQGNAQGPLDYQAQQAEIDRLQSWVDGLRCMLAQVHGDLGTMHREFLWTRLQLLNTLGYLRDQTHRHEDLHAAVLELLLESEPLPAARFDELMFGVTQRCEPLPINQLFPPIEERLVRQDEMFTDMAVDSDSDSDFVDDPSAATVRARAREVLRDMRSGSDATQLGQAIQEGEDGDSDDDLPSLVANEERVQLFALGTTDERPPTVTRAAVRRPLPVGRRPAVNNMHRTCLTAYITINGLSALVLLDSGSTTDSLSPDFARVARVPVLELENPAVLQLGCVGSRSRISHGTTVPMMWGAFSGEVYFDIVNLDRYDAIAP